MCYLPIHMSVCLSVLEYVYVVVVSVVVVPAVVDVVAVVAVFLKSFYLRILEKVFILKWQKTTYTK